MNQTITQNPDWWTDDKETAWNRVKAAMKRDWDQTKHDFGGNQPDTNQNIDNTTRQASGSEAIPPRGEPTYETLEPAYRFGYGARLEYNKDYPEWDDELEARLRQEWQSSHSTSNWEEDRDAIRYGWDYDED